MNHSTTSTARYLLSKYSRSYPVKRTLQKTHPNAQNVPELASEWQHFTNPIIHLVLDVKKTNNADMESVRLRILWQMNSGLDIGNSQPDVAFEDLDLLSFSDMVSNVSRNQHVEGLPLKAVYRDTVVGIRYFHALEDGVVHIYRRFQISFQSAAEASEFIDCIKPVCPCKLNPTSAPPVSSQARSVSHLNRPAKQITARKAFAAQSILPNRGSPYALPSASTNHPTSVQIRKQNAHIPALQPQPHAWSSSPLRYQAISDPPSSLPMESSSSPDEQNEHMSSQPIPMPPSEDSIRLNQHLEFNMPNVVGRNHVVAPFSTNNLLTIPRDIPDLSRLQPLSLPTRCNSPTHIRGAQASINHVARAEPIPQRGPLHPILATLVESASIYDLPESTLEQVIGEVIREDGFIQLLERISEMLTIRRIVNV